MEMTPAEQRSCLLYYFQRENPNSNQANRRTWRNLLVECVNVHYIDCTDLIAGLVVAVVGLLTSLWADCILVVTCTQDYIQNSRTELYIEKVIIQTSQLSHFLVVMTCTAGFIYGIKVKNKSYFTPWIFTKAMELGVIFLGIIILATGTRSYYIGIIPFGVCFLVIGLYITLCVWDTYRKNPMEGEGSQSQSLDEVRIHSQPQNHRLIRDPPPSYDNFLMQEQDQGLPR